VALANTSRGLVEAAHARLARRRTWALNEKGIVGRAGLTDEATTLLHAADTRGLLDAIERIRAAAATPTPA
jgi:hypothetical protein